MLAISSWSSSSAIRWASRSTAASANVPSGPSSARRPARAASSACERGVLGGDQHPVLLAAVAAQLHVVSVIAPGAGSPGRLGDLCQRVGRVFAEAQAARAGGQRVHEPRRLLVERDQGTADRGQLVRVRVLEQRRHDLGGAVGGERQPPALVWAAPRRARTRRGCAVRAGARARARATR